MCSSSLILKNVEKIKFKYPDVEFEFILLIFDANPNVSKQRIKKDIDNKVDRSNVPDEVVDSQYNKFKKLMSELNLEKYKKMFTIIKVKNSLKTYKEFIKK